jgi:hypothetical protein
MKTTLLTGVLLMAVMALGGCAGGESDTAGAAEAVETYLNAMVEADADTMRQNSCAAWEGDAVNQANSFRGLDARIDGLECTVGETDGDYTLVNCAGELIFIYDGEPAPPRPLGTYRAIQEGGAWKMCGEG